MTGGAERAMNRPSIQLFGAVMTLFGVTSIDFELSSWLPAQVVVRALTPLGFKEAAIRATLRRNAEKGLFETERVGTEVRYRLSVSGSSLVSQGQRRVSDPHSLFHGDAEWTLLTIPEGPALRNDRYQLNLRLAWAGFGRLMPGVWITPGRVDVTELMNEAFGPATPIDAVGFIAAPLDDALVSGMISRAWDVPSIRSEHEAFQNIWRAPTLDPTHPLADLVHLLNSWSTLLLADPGLPPSALPADWPANASIAQCQAVKESLWEPARAQLLTLLEK